MIPKSEHKNIKPGVRLYRVINPSGNPEKVPRCVSAPVEEILEGVYLKFPVGQREIIGHSMTANSSWASAMLSLSEKDAWEQYQRGCANRIANINELLAEAEFEMGYVEKLINERFQ